MSARQAADADEAVRELLAALGAGPDADPGPDPADGLPVRTADDGGMPLTEGQRQLWFLQQMDPRSTTYNVCVALRMRGPLREPALAAALTALADRHAVLRLTVATRRGRPLGVLRPPGTPVELRTVDAPADPAGRDGQIQRAAAAEMATPFDLATGPLMRARLLRLAPDDHALLLVWHHLVVDGWSVRIVLRDLAALYSGRAGGPAAALPHLTHGYGDFAAWQTTRMGESPRYRRALEHWRHALADAPDRSAPPPGESAAGHGGRSVHFEVPEATVRAVEALAASSGLTPFAVAFTAFLVWLSGAAGSADVVAGVPSSGRAFPQLDAVVGYFVNLMPLRARLAPQRTFLETAREVQAAVLDGLDHDLVPFDRIVKELGVPRRPGRRPLAQVMFQLLSADEIGATGGDAGPWHGLHVEECTVRGDDGARFEVELDLVHTAGGPLTGCLTVDAGLHPPGTAERFRDAYAALLAELCRRPQDPLGDRVPDPGGLDLLTANSHTDTPRTDNSRTHDDARTDDPGAGDPPEQESRR